MTWKVITQGDGAITNGGDVSETPMGSLTVPTEKGIVSYGQPTCLGAAPITPPIIGSCVGDKFKLWITWKQTGGTDPITIFGSTFYDGDVKTICPTSGTINPTYMGRATMRYNNAGITYISFQQILTSSNIVLGTIFDIALAGNDTINTWNFVQAIPSPYNRRCITVNFDDGNGNTGHITILPVETSWVY